MVYIKSDDQAKVSEERMVFISHCKVPFSVSSTISYNKYSKVSRSGITTNISVLCAFHKSHPLHFQEILREQDQSKVRFGPIDSSRCPTSDQEYYEISHCRGDKYGHLDLARRHRHQSGLALPAISDSFDAFELLGLDKNDVGQVRRQFHLLKLLHSFETLHVISK